MLTLNPILFTFICLLLPDVLAYLNRFARGEGKWPRYAFYLMHLALAFVLSFDIVFSFAWLAFMLASCVPPTHALFSALHRKPPGRDDHWVFNWMRTLAARVNRSLPATPVPELWVRYAVIYGAFRAIPAMVVVAFFAGYTQSSYALVGLTFLATGYLFKVARQLCDRFQVHNSVGVPVAEVILGWLTGVYLIVLVAVAL